MTETPGTATPALPCPIVMTCIPCGATIELHSTTLRAASSEYCETGWRWRYGIGPVCPECARQQQEDDE